MRYLLLIILLLTGNQAYSQHPHHPVVPNNVVRINHNHPHFRRNGVLRHSWGYAYKGRSWNHWRYKHRWSARYGCYCNYCPYTYSWYYWCVPDGCWYPVSYCPYNTYTWDDDMDTDTPDGP